MDDSSKPTPDPSLARLEEVVCEALAQAKGAQPWDENLLPRDERHEAIHELAKQIGPRYAATTLGNYEIYDSRQTVMIERIKRFAEEMPTHLRGGSGLMLFGRPGTGKDHMMAALLKLAIARHRLRVTWYDGGDLLDDIADAITTDRWREFRRCLWAPHVLAISDPVPARGEFTQSQLRRLRDLIDRRYRLGVSTWITTNIDRQADAESALTEPVLDRLREGAVQLFFDWESHRPRIKTSW